MKGRRRNGFFKTVDDSKIYSNLRARLKLSKDRSSPSSENLKGKRRLQQLCAHSSGKTSGKQAEKQAENKRKNKQKNAQPPNQQTSKHGRKNSSSTKNPLPQIN